MATLLRSVAPRLPRRTPFATASTSRRTLETAGAAYPFNPDAQIVPVPEAPVTDKLKRGVGLMNHIKSTLPNERVSKLLANLFGHGSTNRARPGSIIQLTLKRAPFNFSGILMEIRHKGPETSFVLRNVVHRTGVEMRYFVASDNILDIKVQRSADGKEMRRERRNRLFYLRDNPARMNAISLGAKRKIIREKKAARRAEEEKVKQQHKAAATKRSS